MYDMPMLTIYLLRSSKCVPRRSVISIRQTRMIKDWLLILMWKYLRHLHRRCFNLSKGVYLRSFTVTEELPLFPMLTWKIQVCNHDLWSCTQVKAILAGPIIFNCVSFVNNMDILILHCIQYRQSNVEEWQIWIYGCWLDLLLCLRSGVTRAFIGY